MNIFFLKKFFLIIKYLCCIIFLSKCGNQLFTNFIQENNEIIQNNTLQIFLHSYDSFNTITRTIKKELAVNHIIVFDDISNKAYIKQKQLIPTLNIINVSKHYITVSVFSDGTVSEYKIILKIKAQLFIPKTENIYPINICIYRTFMRIPGLFLSNFTQDNEIMIDMYQDIAQKLVQNCLMKLNN